MEVWNTRNGAALLGSLESLRVGYATDSRYKGNNWSRFTCLLS